jgi:hypothetical protein
MLEFNFSTPFIVALLFGIVALVLHYVMVARLLRAGVTVKLFVLMPREQFAIYRAYRFMGVREKWPIWPLYAFWTAVGGMAAAGIYAGLVLHR